MSGLKVRRAGDTEVGTRYEYTKWASRAESPEQFDAAANVYLDRLSAHLAEFVDLGVALDGSAEVVRELPADAELVVMRRQIAGG